MRQSARHSLELLERRIRKVSCRMKIQALKQNNRTLQEYIEEGRKLEHYITFRRRLYKICMRYSLGRVVSRAVGPLRSLFWLVGFDDEMVHAIDDPVTRRASRTDSIVIVLSTVNIDWVIERLGFEGMLPQDVYNQCLGSL